MTDVDTLENDRDRDSACDRDRDDRRGTTPGAPESESLRIAAQTDVPPDARTRECERCGRPFAREEYLVLHRGLAHYDGLTGDEQEAFAAAYDDETADIRRFRILALGGLVLLYFGFLLAYAVFA